VQIVPGAVDDSCLSFFERAPCCIPLIYVKLARRNCRSFAARKIVREGGHAMLRCILAALAALVLVAVCLIPDDAYARRGGGGGFRGGGGGFHGGGMRGGGMHVGGGRVHGGGYRVAGRPGGRPIAGRPGYPGRPIAGRPGRPVAGYPGYGRGYYRPGWGYGAAAVGAAAAAGAYGAYGYYGNQGCYYNEYGQMVCPQYPYRY
jgi:hypothetical protein